MTNDYEDPAYQRGYSDGFRDALRKFPDEFNELKKQRRNIIKRWKEIDSVLTDPEKLILQAKQNPDVADTLIRAYLYFVLEGAEENPKTQGT